MRGNPDNLRRAAARKSTAAQARAEQGLREMIRARQADPALGRRLPRHPPQGRAQARPPHAPPPRRAPSPGPRHGPRRRRLPAAGRRGRPRTHGRPRPARIRRRMGGGRLSSINTPSRTRAPIPAHPDPTAPAAATTRVEPRPRPPRTVSKSPHDPSAHASAFPSRPLHTSHLGIGTCAEVLHCRQALSTMPVLPT